MKIALLTDPVEAGSPGFSGYVRSLADSLLTSASEHEITLVHRGAHSWYEGKCHELGPDARGLRRQIRLPGYLSGRGFELVHDTYHFGPFLAPGRFVRVLTIGDLTPLKTRTHTRARIWAHRIAAPVIAHRADRIVTFSESSKRDIVELFRVRPERITVTYLGVGAQFRPLDVATVVAGRARLGLPERYLLQVGTIEPRKNIDALLRAYAVALPRLGDAHLVLAGRRGWRMEHLPGLVARLGLERRVVVREGVSDGDLPLVYNGALGLAYPSLYEGFGLPPLEAMRCGTPVLTSNVSSLPEVVGNCAITVDPRSREAIARGLVELATNADLRRDLSRRGLERARKFTWKSCAETTLAAYEAAAQRARRRGVVTGTRGGA